MNKLQIPLGVEDFKALRKSSYYVDKTSLLKRVIDAPSSTAFLFTRPRRFGKSLALSMVETFFALGENNCSFFKNTYIEALGNEYLSHANQYPVLHMNLKRIEAKDYDEFLFLLGHDLASLYQGFKQKYNLKTDEYPWFNSIVDEKASESLMKTALDRLVELLHKQLGVKTILLVDEYDSPLEKAYRAGYYEKVQTFVKVFLGDVLKGNHYIEKSIVTGVSQIAHASIFSDLNNLRVNSLLSPSDEEYFGFNESELDELLRYYGCTVDKAKVKQWYGGYLIHGDSYYNPWSVLSFIDAGCEFDTYWNNTGSYSLLKDAVSVLSDGPYGDLLKLSARQSLIASVHKTVTLGQEAKDISSLYGLLIFSGYLTATLFAAPNQYSVVIPNEEIRQAFQSEILSFNGESRLLPLLADLRNAFLNGDATRIKEVLSQYVFSSFSYFDFSCEKIYQIIIATLLSLLFQDAIVKSKVNEGGGRCDLFVRSKRNGRFAFICEFKYRKGKKSSAELTSSAKTALNQIKKKDYAEEAHQEGCAPIYAYGMAFSSKRAQIEYEKLS